MVSEVLLLVALGLILLLGFVDKKPKNLPPGIWGWPLIGKLPSSKTSLSDQVKVLSRKYGKIMSWRIGSQLSIFLSDYKTIKNAFAKPEFTDRPSGLLSYGILNGFSNLGIVFTNGQLWHSNRRFALRQLRDLGMGKTRLEEAIQHEASCLVKDFETRTGKPGSLPWSINVAVLNVIWQLAANRRYNVEDKEIQYFNRTLDEVIQDVQRKVVFFDAMPWLLSFLPERFMQWWGIRDLNEKMKELFDLMRCHIKDHQKTLNPENPRDYIDAYLIEMENQKEDPESTMNVENLVYCLFDLFSAGSETTSSTIRWAIHYLAKYPEVQRKVQKEIDSVVRRDVLPSILQKNSMPYLEAVTQEIHRMVSLVRLGVTHCSSRDTEFEGYTIPKGTMIHANIEGCHEDPAYWEKPHEFYPEHFLDSEGNVLPKKEGFLPFSLGRRLCLGESLARMELFIFLSALLQNFTFSAPEGKSISLEKDPAPSIMSFPQHLDILITKR